MDIDTNEPEWDSASVDPILRSLIFVDLESSGLHARSFPVQYGWCGLDLKPQSFLIRPHTDWTEDREDPGAFDVHGISRIETMRFGLDVKDAAARVAEAFSGKLVATDSTYWDGFWNSVLFSAADQKCPFLFRSLSDVAEELVDLYDPWCVERWEELDEALNAFYPHTHKADQDSMRLAAMYRMVTDREWAGWLLARPIAGQNIGASP